MKKRKGVRAGRQEVEQRQTESAYEVNPRRRLVPISDKMRAGMIVAIKNGLTPEEASRAMGVSKNYVTSMMKEDPEFEMQVLKATENFKLFHLNNISKHATATWQASAWLLERTFPERYNPRIVQENANREKPKQKPKWFGQEIEDAEIVNESEDNGETRVSGEDESDTEQEAEDDKAT